MIHFLSAAPLPTLAEAGGKGASLARLVDAGLPVPDGFILSTAAYTNFVETAGLAPTIATALDGLDTDDPEALRAVSATIRVAFEAVDVPSEIASALVEAYEALVAPPVAVRSSATAEDLPGLSFAGQQETVLNVRGEAELVEAVRRCWSSLWTPRAIGYRARQGIGQEGIAMAVVVQAMVHSEVAGVLFTANPASGARDELVLNASYGLGEAIVSGAVTPDSWVLAREAEAGFPVREATIGAKELRIDASGGERSGVESRDVAADERAAPVLSEDRLRELAALGLAVEEHFEGVPQDIEWAWAEDGLWLLQSRPITGLPEAPLAEVAWQPAKPGDAWIRRQVVEHMPDPLSPLFEDLYLDVGMERSLEVFAEAFGFDMGLIDRMMDRPYLTTVHGFAYMRANYNLGPVIFARILWLYITVVPGMMKGFLPYWRDTRLGGYREIIDRWRMTDAELATAEDARLLEGVRALATEDAVYWFAASMPIAIAKVTDGLLERFMPRLERRRQRALARGADLGIAAEMPFTSGAFLRGFPSDALDAEVALEAMAARIRADDTLREGVLDRPAGEIPAILEASPAGEPLRAALADHLARYGHQIYSLDFATPTQAEEPLPVLLGLKSLVARPERDARAQQAAFAAQREALAEQAFRLVGPLRLPLFRKALAWAQRFTPLREEALFQVGAGWPTLRRMTRELGRRLAEIGTIVEADDIYFLRAEEIQEAISARAKGDALRGLGALARERRALREARMRLHPPQTVPPDFRFKFGPFDMSAFETQKRNPKEGEPLGGFAVSPGRVTAPASVILSPADFAKMRPDTVLVCPTTTPAWTPLFAQAVGLVTDIGGVLAHGSIVAREYGIPAVMGTGVGTLRIRDGQIVTVDGVAGTVEVMEGTP